MDGPHEPGLLRVVAECRSDFRCEVVQVGVHDIRAGPQLFSNRLLVHDARATFEEEDQQIERLWREVQRAAGLLKLARVGVEREVGERQFHAIREFVRFP
jgi:hypothetical protein